MYAKRALDYIDLLIDRVTMYRLLLYYLLALLGAAMFFGALGKLAYDPLAIGLTAGFLVAACWAVNEVFAWVYKVPSNPESSILTGLILALIITPHASLQTMTFLAAAGGLAIASKYILAINHKHIFNPAAIAVVLTAFGPQESASWWVGSTLLLPFVILGGIIIVRKTRRLKMVGSFFVIALVAVATSALVTQNNIASTLQATVLHSSLFFLGFVMLTEPLTSPSIFRHQLWYVTIVGICFVPQLHVGSVFATPELALVIGNIASFFMTPNVRTLLSLSGRQRWGVMTQDFLFTPEKSFAYVPGQYIELTLPHDHTDTRGSRRYFTLASSPTEDSLRIGARFYEHGSSFKRALNNANEHTPIAAGQLAGEFTLPRDVQQKLAFIAGGIGITPFRSMAKYLVDTNERRSAILLYGERTLRDVAYSDVFEAARQIGVRTTYVIGAATEPVSEHVRTGRVTQELIRSEIPDFAERLFYVSGPRPMVLDVQRMLLDLGVTKDHIKVDYFSGYA